MKFCCIMAESLATPFGDKAEAPPALKKAMTSTRSDPLGNALLVSLPNKPLVVHPSRCMRADGPPSRGLAGGWCAVNDVSDATEIAGSLGGAASSRGQQRPAGTSATSLYKSLASVSARPFFFSVQVVSEKIPGSCDALSRSANLIGNFLHRERAARSVVHAIRCETWPHVTTGETCASHQSRSAG